VHGGPSAGSRRTVREGQVDRPRVGHRPSEITTQTSSSALRKTNCPWWTHSPSALSQTVRHRSTDCPQTPCNKNLPTQWIETRARKNKRRTRRTASQSSAIGPSAGTWRTVRHARIERPELDTVKVNSLFPSPDLSNQPMDHYLIGEDEVYLGDAVLMNLWPQTNWNERNRDFTMLKQKPRVPTEICESEAKSDVWGVKIIHKDAQDIHPWSPQRNLNKNSSKSTNQAMYENPTKIAWKDTKITRVWKCI
jgi:hypothetical protein